MPYLPECSRQTANFIYHICMTPISRAECQRIIKRVRAICKKVAVVADQPANAFDDKLAELRATARQDEH
jgi:hypothetical protein